MAMCLPMAAVAQDNSWEQNTTAVKANVNPKYLAGAVPEVDGKVVFETTIEAPGKTKKQIYDLLLEDMTRLTKEDNQFEQSTIVQLENNDYSQIVGSYQEWLVFKNKPLVLDRTRLFYHLIAEIKDGEATIKMTRIHYLYDEEREPTPYKAEEWINDKYGLNKKMTKTSRVSGKFRIKTIDRKDYLFNRLTKVLNK
jgi:colicin import membrane protein